jgi:uncharacterized membrane protein
MRMTRRLIVFDWLTAWCNLLLLGCVTLIPFGTSAFGSHFTSMAGIQVYWTIMMAAALAMTLMFIVVSRDKGRLIGGISTREWWARFITSLGPVIAFAAGAYFAAIDQVWATRFAAFIMFPIMLLPRLFYRPAQA